jgi:hypothetical protein
VDTGKGKNIEEDNTLIVIPKGGGKWEDVVKRTITVKEIMNDFGKGFADEDWEEDEEEMENEIPEEEMKRRLIFTQFFDSYFDGTIFNMDNMI